MSTAKTPMSLAAVWNDILAPKFIRHREVLIRGAEPHGQKALTLFRPRPADRALDVGCGFGDTTLALADCVGPLGFVTGLDVVPAFLDFGRDAASAGGVRNVDWAAADAETFAPDGAFDYLFARFGTMFFERPLAAFRNLRALLRPQGRLVMTTWRALRENPWLGVAKDVARTHLPPLTEDAVSCGPGPFSLSAAEQVHELLSRAGFREVSLVANDAATLVGTSLDDAIDFQLALGPAGEIVREAGLEGQRALPDLRRALEIALAPFLRKEGVCMPSAAWIVDARA